MILSDLSVKRPVLAIVISLLLVAGGVIAFNTLPLREYPDIEPPIISVNAVYPGASASIVETRVTEVLEDAISGVEGIRYIESSSRDGSVQITVEFVLERDIDTAANDVRDRVSRVLNALPEEVESPEIFKVDADADPIMYLGLTSESADQLALSDYADRQLVERFSTIQGISQVRVIGEKRYAMRIWLNPVQLQAHQVTVAEVANALRQENVELPGGRIESENREMTVRIDRQYQTPDDFAALVIRPAQDSGLVQLGDVARIERGAESYRTSFQSNGRTAIGLGLVKQSEANTLAVSQRVRALLEDLRPQLPDGYTLSLNYDASTFVDKAIFEVYRTLAIAIGLVVLVIYLFLGSVRATIIPACVIPVALVASFMVLLAFDFSINLLTLLAFVLAIGLVVDDTIVVLENISRRLEQGKQPIQAAYHGSRQVGTAVISTTLVLVAVFVPISFLSGDIGRLFTEFSYTMAAAVIFSSLVALTLGTALSSLFLKEKTESNRLTRTINSGFEKMRDGYRSLLGALLRQRWITGLFVLITLGLIGLSFYSVPKSYAPTEDRGVFFVIANGPEGASFPYMQDAMAKVEKALMPLVEQGEADRILTIIPRGRITEAIVNEAFVVVSLVDWQQRERKAGEIMAAIRPELQKIPELELFPFQPRSLSTSFGKPLQLVVPGTSYATLHEQTQAIVEAAQQSPILTSLDTDYNPRKPQLSLELNKARAGELGVPLRDIGSTMETLYGGRDVTSYTRTGESYEVMLEVDERFNNRPDQMDLIYLRSRESGELVPLTSLVNFKEQAEAPTLGRYNRNRAITISGAMQGGASLGEALNELERIAQEHTPENTTFGYKGVSLDFTQTSGSVLLVFALALMIAYLVLAGQFESFLHPMIIMFSVPMAVLGGLLGIWMFGQTLNIYSQIGLIMLIGLAAKNGILIVEFANQLRAQDKDFREALIEASETRLRPILMTGFTSAMGAVPLLAASGAGEESRFVIGITVLVGVIFANLFTLIVVPVAYDVLAGLTPSPHARIAKRTERLK